MSTATARNIFENANVIFTYTRAQAISDGVLVDLSRNFPSDTRMFKWNLCCTSSVWSLIESTATAEDVEVAVYVWDVAFMALNAINSATGQQNDELLYTVMMPLTENGTEYKLKLVCGPGDSGGEPVLTIMLPYED